MKFPVAPITVALADRFSALQVRDIRCAFKRQPTLGESEVSDPSQFVDQTL
jgi:hypothetical protein